MFRRPRAGCTLQMFTLAGHSHMSEMQNEPDGLPSVAGEYTGTLEDFERAARVCIAAEQEKFMSDNALVSVLCDAVRIARALNRSNTDCVELTKMVASGRRQVDGMRTTIAERDRTVSELERALTLVMSVLVSRRNLPRSREQRYAIEISDRDFSDVFNVHEWRVDVYRPSDSRGVTRFTLEPR